VAALVPGGLRAPGVARLGRAPVTSAVVAAVWFRPSDPAVTALVASEDVVGLAAKAAGGGPAQPA